MTGGASVERRGFDPRGTWALVATCLAVVAFFVYRAPGLGTVSTYPELRLSGPTRALLQQSLVEHAAGPATPPWSWLPGCELCTHQGVSDAWLRLGALYDTYDDLPPGLEREQRGFARAREISLGIRGDAPSLERVPDPAAAARALTKDGDELAGVHVVEQRRVHGVRWGLLGLDVAFATCALLLWLRLRRDPVAPTPGVFGASQATCLFVWCVGGSAAMYGWLSDVAWLPDVYPLLDVAFCLPVAALALQGGSWGALLTSLGFGSFRPRVVLAYTTLIVGGVAVFDWGTGGLYGLGGYVGHWAQTAGDVLHYGTAREKGLDAFGLLVGAPLFEEALFTGLLFGGLSRHFSFRTAALLVGITFAVDHAYDLPGSLGLVASSMLSCWAFAKTGSIWPSICAHSILNASFASAALY